MGLNGEPGAKQIDGAGENSYNQAMEYVLPPIGGGQLW